MQQPEMDLVRSLNLLVLEWPKSTWKCKSGGISSNSNLLSVLLNGATCEAQKEL